jgi:hypothetical protein
MAHLRQQLPIVEHHQPIEQRLLHLRLGEIAQQDIEGGSRTGTSLKERAHRDARAIPHVHDSDPEYPIRHRYGNHPIDRQRYVPPPVPVIAEVASTERIGNPRQQLVYGKLSGIGQWYRPNSNSLQRLCGVRQVKYRFTGRGASRHARSVTAACQNPKKRERDCKRCRKSLDHTFFLQ